MNKRKLGQQKELEAAEYLQTQGYQIVEQNYFCRFSEIDIIAQHEDYLCFIEVKYRKNAKFEAPEGVISFQKQRKLCQGARFYMAKNHIMEDTPIRFDVIFLIEDEIQLIKNAFDYIG